MDFVSDEDAYFTTRSILVSVLRRAGGSIKLSAQDFEDSVEYDLVVIPCKDDIDVLEIRLTKKPQTLM